MHVAKHLQRCTELKFIGPNDLFSLFPASQLPNLRSLQVNLPHELYKPFALSCSPQILQVSLSLNSFSKFSIGFGNLVTFKGRVLVAQKVFELLQKAVYLTSLSVYEILGNFEASDAFMENQTLEHRSLQTLQVGHRSAVPLSLLSYLTLPMIKSLLWALGSWMSLTRFRHLWTSWNGLHLLSKSYQLNVISSSAAATFTLWTTCKHHLI